LSSISRGELRMSDESGVASQGSADAKNWKLLETTLLASVQEQRRARRWGIFFKVLTFTYLFIALLLFSPAFKGQSSVGGTGKHTALIEIRGVIADKEAASADNIVGSL